MTRNARILALASELTGKTDGCTLWRVLQPFTELQRQGFQGIEWGFRDDDRLANYAHMFDAIVLPRLHWPPEERDKAARWFNALHKAGIAIIYECDDDLFSDGFVSRLVSLHGYDRKEAEIRRDCILHVVQNCDGVTVSNQRMATIVSRYTDRIVKVVPNFIDLRWFRAVQKAVDRVVPGLTIGWAGGNRPDEDVAMMARAWSRLAEKYPQVMFVVQGHHAPVIYEYVPNDRIAALDWLPIEEYPAGLVNIDIGCCPLGDNYFNRAKTHIKAMEYAASGAAVVASPTVYGKFIEHGKDGYIANTVDEWEQYLSMLIEDYDLRRRLQRRLLAKVRKYHSLENNAWRWVEAWNAIVENFRFRQKNRILLPREVINYAYS